MFTRFEEIVAWQKGRELVSLVYSTAREGGLSHDFGMKDQIQRAAVSICSNIAEGYERRGNREFVKFLWIAKGSAAEVSSLLYLLKDLNYLTEDKFNQLFDLTKQIGGMLQNLIRSLIESPQGPDYVRS